MVIGNRREVLYWEGNGMGLTRRLFSAGVDRAVLRDGGLRASREQRSNTRPDLKVIETDLATKNVFAGVRGGDDVNHQTCSRLLSTETNFVTTYPGTRSTAFFMHPLRLRKSSITW